MSRTRFQAKQNGRRILDGKWLPAMFITFLVFLLNWGVSRLEETVRSTAKVPETIGSGILPFPNLSAASLIITVIFLVVSFLILAPLQTGQAEWYWQLASRRENSVGNVFGWLGSPRLFGKSLRLTLGILWRTVLWAVPAYAAPAVLLLVYWYPLHGGNTVVASLVLVLAVVLAACASLVLLYIVTRYFPARFLLVEDSSRNTGACIRDAVHYTRGFRMEVFKFELSFVLWVLLCGLIFPIFYVQPYYNASSTVLAQHIIFSSRAREQQKTDGTPPAAAPNPAADKADDAKPKSNTDQTNEP